MKQIFGWAEFDRSTFDDKSVESVVQRCFSNQKDHIAKKTFGGSGVFKCHAKNNHDIYQNEKLLIVMNGRAHFNDRSMQKEVEEQGLAKSIAKLYEQLGTSLLKKLYGSFALAIIDAAEQQTVLAVDRLGICPLSYSASNSCLVFGSDALLINSHRNIDSTIDPQAIFNYLYFHVVPIPQNIFKNIVRLSPGEYVVYKQGTVQHSNYWVVDYLQKHTDSEKSLGKELFTILHESINEAVADCKNPGAFLSGGIDSSTVAGMLGKVTGTPAKTYSIGFDAEGFDEMTYARISAKHFNTDHHEYYVTPQDVLNAIPRIAKIYDQPYGNASAVPAYYCAQLAKNDGVDRLLAGDGGDELFGGNARYAKQNVFSFYDKIPRVLRNQIIEPVFTGLFANSDFTPFNKIRSYVQQANIPMPDRMETYNLLNRIGLQEIFQPEFLEKIDSRQPVVLQKLIYDAAKADNLIDNMLALDLKFTLADNDLPKVTKMCELAEIDVTFPWLSDQMVEYSAKLPAHYKVKGTKLRYFIKQYLAEFLPEATIKKEKQGFGLPFGIWLLNYKPLHDFAYDKINELKKREIVNSRFLDDLMKKQLSAHATYYGTFVWVLLMLEEWHQQHIH